MSVTYKNYIDGSWEASATHKTFKNNNPADTMQVVGEFADSGRSDINYACTAAAMSKRKWADTPAPKRAELLFEIGQELIDQKENLSEIMTKEMGKVRAETRGDVQEAIDMAFYAAGEGRRMAGETVPSESVHKWAMSKRVPVGVIGCITPWNFPLAIPSWKIFPALIAGNTVVIKPAEDTPHTVMRFAEICAGFLPHGVLNVVTGYGETAGEPLVNHPLVNFISFTGSTETGTKVAQMCAAQGKPYSLEMGGKNVIIVMDDADIELAVEGVIWGAFGTSGQRCTATSRVLVQEQIHDLFVKRLLDATEKLIVGDGMIDDIDIGPVINAKQLTKIDSYVTLGQAEGAEMLCGGKYVPSPEDPLFLERGHFYRPTIFENCDSKMRIMQEEIFGPVAGIIKVKDFDEAIKTANEVTYGLSGAIYTRNVNTAFHFIEQIETGLAYVNASTIGAEIQLPFGGVKGTGNGHREAGTTMIDNCTEWKSIYVDYSGKLQKAQID